MPDWWLCCCRMVPPARDAGPTRAQVLLPPTAVLAMSNEFSDPRTQGSRLPMPSTSQRIAAQDRGGADAMAPLGGGSTTYRVAERAPPMRGVQTDSYLPAREPAPVRDRDAVASTYRELPEPQVPHRGPFTPPKTAVSMTSALHHANEECDFNIFTGEPYPQGAGPAQEGQQRLAWHAEGAEGATRPRPLASRHNAGPIRRNAAKSTHPPHPHVLAG